MCYKDVFRLCVLFSAAQIIQTLKNDVLVKPQSVVGVNGVAGSKLLSVLLWD